MCGLANRKRKKLRRLFDTFFKNVDRNLFKFNNKDSKNVLDLLKDGFWKTRMDPFHQPKTICFLNKIVKSEAAAGICSFEIAALKF